MPSIPFPGVPVPPYRPDMETGEARAGPFGAKLRRWRRARGLTQLALATRAATTARHLSFLETGRSRPRAELVGRLADALGLPPREHNALLAAAGLPARFPQRPLDDDGLAPYSDALETLLRGHEPLPAAVLDRYGAVVRANAAFERLTPGLVGLSPEELVDRHFGPGPWRDAVANWPEVAAAWLARQRQEADRTGDPRLHALVARAEALIGPLPRDAGAGDSPTACARLRVDGEVLELFALVARFDAAHDVTLGELRIELMYPGNDAAARRLAAAARG
jgi:transcriptional regulator with XRE-family HTH domain